MKTSRNLMKDLLPIINYDYGSNISGEFYNVFILSDDGDGTALISWVE